MEEDFGRENDELIEKKNRINLLSYIYATDIINKKLKNKFTFYQIHIIIDYYTNKKIMQEQQYLDLLKQTKGLSQQLKHAIKKHANNILQNTHLINNLEIRDIIEKKKNKEIEESRIIKYIQQYQNNHQDLEMHYIKYYYNKKLIDQMMKIIDQNITMEVHNIEDYQNVLKVYNNVIYNYLKDQNYIGYKRLPQDVTLSKINKYEDLLKNRNYLKLKRVLKIKSTNSEKIEEEARRKIAYLKYIRETEMVKHETDKADYKRIVQNKIENVTNKHLDKRTGPPPDRVPSDEATYEFWQSILGTASRIDRNNEKVKEISEYRGKNEREVIITEDDVINAIRAISNWKSPGNDAIQGYYIKYAKKYYKALQRIFQRWIDNPEEIPDEYMQGRTILVYKGGNSEDPANYRPITCMNVISKVFTGIFKNKIMEQLRINEEERQISFSQLGNKHMSLGAKEGLIANKAIQDMENRSQRKFIEMYYDVRKAFDSVNHAFMLETLEYYKVPAQIVNCIEYMMTKWSLKMRYNQDSNIEAIKLRRGIIQGDSLSPLMFILYINVVSKALNSEIEMIEITRRDIDEDYNGNTDDEESYEEEEERIARVNHFFYVDDLKVIVEDPIEAVKAHELVKETMKAIALDINMSKCGIVAHNGMEIPEDLREIPVNNNQNPYRYLGLPSGDKVVTEAAIEEIKKKIKDRMEQLDRNNSSSVNYITRLRSLIVSLMRYSFATIDWPITQLNEIDALVRKQMTKAGMYGRGMSRPRLYVSRKELGHGVPCIRDEYGYELLTVLTHYEWTEDQNTAIIVEQDEENVNSMRKRMMKVFRKKISLAEIDKIKQKYQDKQGDKKKNLVSFIHEVRKKVETYYINEWKQQKVVGELRRQFESEHVHKVETGKVWAKFNIKKSAYRWVVRMQEGSTMNGNKRAQLTGNPQAKFCKLCKNRIASNNHVLLECILNRKKHIKKHDYIAEQGYRKMEDKKGFPREVPIQHYQEKEDMKMFWNTNVVSTAAGGFPKRPDVMYKDKENIIIMDAALVADHNIHKTFAHKLKKYDELIEFFKSGMRVRKEVIIPLVISINGLIHKDTIRLLKKERIAIDWITVVRNILVRNMKDVLYYNGVNLNLEFDEEDEEDDNSNDELDYRTDDEKLMHLFM